MSLDEGDTLAAVVRVPREEGGDDAEPKAEPPRPANPERCQPRFDAESASPPATHPTAHSARLNDEIRSNASALAAASNTSPMAQRALITGITGPGWRLLGLVPA